MDLNLVTGRLIIFSHNISLDQAAVTLQPLVLFSIGMVIYAIFIFKFYRYAGGKNVFKPIDSNASAGKKILHILEYLFFYPVIAFFWFLVMSVLLATLSQTVLIADIFRASMATIVTVRVTSYYNEDLSKDIAKLVPLTLLGLMLLDITKITVNAPLSVILQLPTSLETLFYYFIFLVLVEFTFRLGYFFERNHKRSLK